jgi:predicted RNase H-like HicB family nuclease
MELGHESLHLLCVPLKSGGWRVLFPDVPACRAEADSLEVAIARADRALARYAVALNGNRPNIPLPCDLSEIVSDERWTSEQGVDWSTAIITMMPLRMHS